MNYLALLSVWTAIIVWSSAFVAIRSGLQEFSPGGMALFRFIVASICMGIVYATLKNKKKPPLRDIIQLMLLGMIGVGLYNVFLNYGELAITSGVSSFIISQSPLLTAIFTAVYFQEKITSTRLVGFLLSLLGVIIMSWVELLQNWAWSIELVFIFLATILSAVYSISQKSLLRNANPIEATAFIIWGSTLFLCFYFPDMLTDLSQVSHSAIGVVIYLGIFPAALGYIMWAYALSHLPTTQVVSYLYFSPFIATLLGWLWLNEVPTVTSLLGGVFAMIGVYFVNRSYLKPSIIR